MVSFTQATVAIAAFIGLTQLCPAPIIPIIEITVDMGTAAAWVGAIGGVTGGAAAAASAVENAKHKKRDAEPETAEVQGAPFFSRIKRQEQNQLAWQECHDDLQKSNVGFSSPATGTILTKGVPATCMTLATVITGQYDIGHPVPMGSDSLQFSGLSNEQIDAVVNALKARSD